MRHQLPFTLALCEASTEPYQPCGEHSGGTCIGREEFSRCGAVKQRSDVVRCIVGLDWLRQQRNCAGIQHHDTTADGGLRCRSQ